MRLSEPYALMTLSGSFYYAFSILYCSAGDLFVCLSWRLMTEDVALDQFFYALRIGTLSEKYRVYG